jgi:hypothetical protein
VMNYKKRSHQFSNKAINRSKSTSRWMNSRSMKVPINHNTSKRRIFRKLRKRTRPKIQDKYHDNNLNLRSQLKRVMLRPFSRNNPSRLPKATNL